MTAKTDTKEALSAMLIGRWEQMGQKVATLAEAVPEREYGFKPIAGTRTFGEVLRHVAFWNQFVADSARGKKADQTANELPEAEYSTKEKMIGAVKRTTAEAATALRGHQGGLEPETAEMVTTLLEHAGEHYGQLAVYARLKGIVPPASR